MSNNAVRSFSSLAKLSAWQGNQDTPALKESVPPVEDQPTEILTQVYCRFTELMSGSPDQDQIREAQQWMMLWTRLYTARIRSQQRNRAETRRRMRKEMVVQCREDLLTMHRQSKAE